MKKISIFILLLSLASLSIGQDLIINKSGKRIVCNITKEDSLNIYFIFQWNNNQINSFIIRNEIKTIRYDYMQKRRDKNDSLRLNDTYNKCITYGVLNGGGSLLGMDLEIGLTKSIGIQAGAGFVGMGAGLNFHFKPTLRSSFLSFQYWHQGILDSYSQSLLGPSIVFRAKKVFTAQIGLGFVLEKGPAWPETMEQPPVMLTYSIGIYFPQK
ncbi:MAG: hypothetical protein EHM20_15225 [Alphaproteobacteria bacterium]|nr:MAG: hypothetical protein EHM20_15225 [Alphaproteobacteria bacterium]